MRKTDSAADHEVLKREALELTPALYALARVLRFRGVAEAELPSLAPSELEVLRYVLDAPGTGTRVLAQELGLHSSNVSAVVRGLVALGLVRRETDPRDRRAVRLYPTRDAEHGMALIEDAWAGIVADGIAVLTHDQRIALAAAVPALRTLGAALRERRTAHG
ncbi:MarR family transcriptional regulator [Nocardia sp. NPDC050712]|uniref:MarR family winged helix-turn-helix transcriptional regulator n=1 Tax=Nocardia sp. NPDC050712 TaxID=3155518 RepID=UPI0033CC9EFD